MAKILKRLLQYLLLAYFVFTIYQGVILPQNPVYIIATFLLFSIAIFLSSALLGFLTIKENFITSLLMTTLLSIGVFFLVEAFMPGFEFNVYTFEGLDTGNLVINSFEVTSILTNIISSVTIAFISSILNVLEKSS